nr:MAG TPA: hypothetical protein [Caudoviricetes sp.]
MPLNRKIKRFINDSKFGACAEKMINGKSTREHCASGAYHSAE